MLERSLRFHTNVKSIVFLSPFQQLANIAVHTSNERRYFKAVAGCKSRPGELFGASNLFTLRTGESNLTNELLKRTERIESGVKVSNYELAESQNAKGVVGFLSISLSMD